MDKDAVLKESEAAPVNKHKRNFLLLSLSVFFVVIGILWILYWLIWGRFEIYTDDAYVNGNVVQLMPQTPGTVVNVYTDDTQLVKAGQTIIQLDSSDYVIALEKAKANLAQTTREVRQYFEKAEQAQQKVILDKATLKEAQLNLQRRQGLTGTQAVSREEMAHYRTALQTAEASYQVSLHQLKAARALVQNAHLYHHPLVETAKANLKNAYLNLQRTTIKAPMTGYVAKKNVQPGQQVTLNNVMLSIIPLQTTWVDANYKESEINKIRINQPVTLFSDAYPHVKYHGVVQGLNAGTGSAFALLPAENATGNWIKVVQRIPVRIRLNPEELKKVPLQLGLSMRVTIDVHNLKGNRMAMTPGPKLNFQTTIYQQQLSQVEHLIQEILHQNSRDMVLSPVVN